MQANRTDEPAETFRAYLRAHEVFDWDGMRSFLSPGARMWYNYRTDKPDGLSADEALGEIEHLTSVPSEMEFIFDRPWMETTDQFAVQLTCRAKTRAGATFLVPAIFMGRVDGDGKITEYQEFLDPTAMSTLFVALAE